MALSVQASAGVQEGGHGETLPLLQEEQAGEVQGEDACAAHAL